MFFQHLSIAKTGVFVNANVESGETTAGEQAITAAFTGGGMVIYLKRTQGV